MNLSEIPTKVIEACRERCLNDRQIESLSKRELFEEFCNWHGLINWGDTLYSIVECLVRTENK